MINPYNNQCPLIIYIGGTFELTLTLNNGVIGNPVDLTGLDIIMQVRPQVGSNIVLAELSTDNGNITVPDPTTGLINLNLPASFTMNMAPKSAVYDIRFGEIGAEGGFSEGFSDGFFVYNGNEGGTEIEYFLQGAILIQQMVTRP